MKKGVVFLGGLLLGVTVVAQTPPGAVQQAALSRARTDPVAVERKSSAPAKHFGIASWYGENHRGRLMANGRRFDPDKLTAASWFYPLGTRVRVSLRTDPRVLNPQPQRSVVVTITDRGPAHRLVRDGRIVDLSHEVFRRLADPELGLVEVVVSVEMLPAQSTVRLAGG